MCCIVIPPIPIASEETLYEKPTITYTLLGLEVGFFTLTNIVAIFAGLGIAPPDLYQTMTEWFGYIPDEKYPWTFFTYALLHGDIMHLVGNLLPLWIFGVFLEQKLKKKKYLAVVVAGSVFACLGHEIAITELGSTELEGAKTPMIGASGFIAAIMGAFLILLPYANVRCFYLFLFIFFVRWGKVTIPAVIYIPVFFFWGDIYSLIYHGADTEVAHGAHLGGAAFGILFGLMVRFAPTSRRALELEEEQQLEEQTAKARLAHENFRKALAQKALEPALAIIRETQLEGRPLKPTTHERILLATLFEETGQSSMAAQSYRNLMAGDLDFDQRLEIGLRLAKILLVVERDLEATKGLLRLLYQEYQTDPRLARIQEMIEQVKETERNLFKRPR